ncbi:hypothetical protein GWI33_009127 [Rhynchophorus ferrugineus]|uniref:Uncharacterized protein n=1 Tax=Rhynchophorus ferrugineus TaxID=354439 RepID=A0A834MBS2_RHYFE|nr:hypothetical protein GWI33_009127 [Rhynchophorus ferrugineus]
MVVHVDQLSFFDISFTLYKMAHQYKKSYPFYYQEVFFDTVANQCIEMKANLRNSMYVMRQLARLRHFHKNLLDYVSKLVYDDPHQPCHPIDCFSLVIALALTDYKPVHWDAIRDWIRNARDLGLENKKEILWIRFAASLCVLGIYKADVLSRTLSSSYVEHLLSKGFMSDFENYFTIWKMLNIYNPDLADLLPSNLEPKLLVDRINLVKDYPLEAPLEKCLGGPEFLLTKLYSKLGDIIDHAMVFDRNGCPVNLNPVTFIEDIDLHNDNQLVLILDLHESHYTINDKRLRLSVIKSIEILESTVPNCNVIPISNDSWNELEEFERLPYLTQKIKEKLDLDISVSHQIV